MLLKGYGGGGFAITTKVPEAQAFFSNGMELGAAFAHPAAIAAMKQAVTLDPACAMCKWGESLVDGPTINYGKDAKERAPLHVLVRDAQREAAQRFVDAYLRGTRDYNDAFLKNRDREAVLATIARNVGIDPAIMAKVYPAAIDPDGRVDVASLKDNQDWFVRQGFVQTPVDVDRIVDTSFADAAVQRFGPYQR